MSTVILGGSTIGAAVGVDPYTSPIRLWLELTRGERRQANEAMRLGTMLEPVIFRALRAFGVPAKRSPSGAPAWPDKGREWLAGHPDGFLVDGSAVVEAKAAGHGYTEPPLHWQAQVQTYLHLTGLDGALVAQLAGLHLSTWEVERDQRAIDALLELAQVFVGYVERREQPPPLGHPDDRAAILLANPEPTRGLPRRETREVKDARKELARLLEAEKARKARIEHLRAVVTDYLADADTLISEADDVVATWKPVTSRRMDTTRFREDHPDLAGEYTTETTTRRLVLT